MVIIAIFLDQNYIDLTNRIAEKTNNANNKNIGKGGTKLVKGQIEL